MVEDRSSGVLGINSTKLDDVSVDDIVERNCGRAWLTKTEKAQSRNVYDYFHTPLSSHHIGMPHVVCAFVSWSMTSAECSWKGKNR